VIVAFNVIDGKLGEQVSDVRRCQQGQVNLLRCHFRLLLPEKSDNLKPELNDGDEAERGALMILFYFGRNDPERCLD